MNVGDVLQVIATMLAAIGLILTSYQIRNFRKQQRLSTLDSYWQRFWSDSRVAEMFYRIEYDQFHYKEDEFHRSEDERTLDRLLGIMQSIALCDKAGMVARDDMRHVAYHAVRLLCNLEVKKYFTFLDEWFFKMGFERHPYKDAEEMANRLYGHLMSESP